MPLICPTIHPLAMMTVSDGNLQNLQIGSTTNNATDPNDHEPPSSSSSAENVHSLSHTQGPHNRQIFSARNQTTKVDLAQRISPSPRSFFSTLSREKKAPLARDGWLVWSGAFFRPPPFNLRRRQFSAPSVTQKSFAAAAAAAAASPRSPDDARLNSMTSFTWHAHNSAAKVRKRFTIFGEAQNDHKLFLLKRNLEKPNMSHILKEKRRRLVAYHVAN